MANRQGIQFIPGQFRIGQSCRKQSLNEHIQIRKDSQMKAVVYEKYGSPDVLELQEVNKPALKD